MLMAKASDMSRQPGWSEVTYALKPSEWSRVGSEGTDLGFWGDVDGECAGLGGVAWMFDLVHGDDRWLVMRSLKLNRNTTTYQEIVADLPETTHASSSELASSLTQLVAELMRLPSPDR
jgi:hypothetical protein